MGIIPNSRPQMGKADVEKILKAKGIDRKAFPVCVLAVRGYYLNSMGKKGENDRGIYDDAVFVDSPTLFVSCNWNTDPSSYRKGRGKGSQKGMASLKVGVWDYQIGPHKGKSPACRQAQAVTVVRDGSPDYEDTGWFGINHHWGGRGTSSLGCQTAPPNQWPSYINPLVAELKRYSQKVFKYVLIDEAERVSILASNESPKSEGKSFFMVQPALDLIKEFEGCRLEAYLDPVGIPTIGWGTTVYPDGKPVRMGDRCSQDQADLYLEHDVRKFANAVDVLVQRHIPHNAFCALVSFTYNVGAGALKSSTLLRKLNSGETLAEVALEFQRWVKAGGVTLKGLVRRREAERDLFLSA